MNIRDLEYLVALSEYKHFRRAAEVCHVSQPTLSGQIRKLEDELGTILLERTSRKVLFTQSGLLLVEQAKTILREVKLLREMASNQSKEMSGPLHIGVIPTISPYLLPYIMPTLKREYPDLELFLYEAQTAQLVDQLESGRLDCAIVAAAEEADPFINVPIFNEKMLLAVSEHHHWAKEKQIKLSELKGKAILMLDDGHCLRDQALGYCFTAGAKEDTHFQATSLETLRNMVASNAGITLMPQLAMLHDANRQGVTYIPCTDPEPTRSISLIYRPGSPLRQRYERIAQTIANTIKPILVEK
ncbi:DNA-binding transcriptional regulator OxyR [Pasteurellaceae bacterium 22721_9_1]